MDATYSFGSIEVLCVISVKQCVVEAKGLTVQVMSDGAL
jgi:hypothetical protein